MNNIAANVIEIMYKELKLDQQIKKEISNILKKEAKTITMEHNELVKYLENALRDASYNDLTNFNIFKSGALIRDPITKEMTIPERDYSIATDSDYITINYNDMTRKLYQVIRDKTIPAYFKFRQTRHAAVMNTKVSKDGRKQRSIDLSDTV